MKFVISGYYGFNNSGDDALLLSIINGIKETYEDADITVLSNSPSETRKNYGVDAVNRYNIAAILYHIKKCDLLISGGGTLIQDATSTKSLLYYLFVIKLAKMLNKKVMLYANGVGPLNSFKNIEKTKKILNETDLITLRDENSLKELEQIGVCDPVIKLTADPAFLLEADDKCDDILKSYGVPQDLPLMCISVRKWKNNPKNFEEIIAQFCDNAYEKYGLFTVLMPMQQNVDFEIATDIKNKMKNRAVILGTKYPVSTVMSVMRKMTVCVGMRLHTLIYAANCIVPTVGLVYDPKVSGFMDYMGEDRLLNIEDVSVEKLEQLLDVVCTDYDSIRSHIKLNIYRLKEKAKENNELMKKLLDGGAF